MGREWRKILPIPMEGVPGMVASLTPGTEASERVGGISRAPSNLKRSWFGHERTQGEWSCRGQEWWLLGHTPALY